VRAMRYPRGQRLASVRNSLRESLGGIGRRRNRMITSQARVMTSHARMMTLHGRVRRGHFSLPDQSVTRVAFFTPV
jgi:hypothetical protein